MKGSAKQRKEAWRERIFNLVLILVFLAILGSVAYILVRSLVKWSVPGLG
jgi:hypothetical protein